jgi:hypothetical protein
MAFSNLQNQFFITFFANLLMVNFMLQSKLSRAMTKPTLCVCDEQSDQDLCCSLSVSLLAVGF